MRDIRLDFDRTGFTVVDHRDIPGRNIVDLIEQDQPFLVEHEVRHMAEPILLLAHESADVLNAARVVVDYEERAPLFDPELSEGVFKQIDIVKGDVDAALRGADRVIEGTYRTGHQEHVYIETNGVIAVPEDGGVAVYGSIQCPFYALKALKCMLGANAKIRVIQTETGGGFGGKEEYPSMIAGHAALLALKSQRPVKIIYDRVEDMIATTKRHPSIVRHRTGVKRDGRLVAMEIDVLLDGGAYVTLSPVVLSRGCIHAAGPYRCENIRIHGRTVFTNTPPNGAFRGFGAPQTQFAVEVHMERIAEALGMDPVALARNQRPRAGRHDGDRPAPARGHERARHQVLAEAVRRTDFRQSANGIAARTRRSGSRCSITARDSPAVANDTCKSRARLELTATGVRIAVGSTEIGQGTRTMHAQIVADALAIPYETVEVAQPDTSALPTADRPSRRAPAWSSARFSRIARTKMRETARPADARRVFCAAHGEFTVERKYEPPDWIEWDDHTYRGDAYASYGMGLRCRRGGDRSRYV